MPVLRETSAEFLSGPALHASWLGVSALASLVIAIAAFRLKALTVSGAIAAFFVGLACLGAGGLGIGTPLFVFFVTGSLLSRSRSKVLVQSDGVGQKGATRDAVQVLANGGAAAVCAVVAGVLAHGGSAHAFAWYAASVGAIAVAAADTWATEIGARSPTMPRSIATGRVVPPGSSGGVTPLGFLASVAGGAAIGIAAATFMPAMRFPMWVALGAAVGFTGSALDSFLGARLQGLWHCDRCDVPCEARRHRCGAQTRRVRGFRWFDNDGVNALSTVAGALLGSAASTAIG